MITSEWRRGRPIDVGRGFCKSCVVRRFVRGLILSGSDPLLDYNSAGARAPSKRFPGFAPNQSAMSPTNMGAAALISGFA
jgi:hypothetical protein